MYCLQDINYKAIARFCVCECVRGGGYVGPTLYTTTMVQSYDVHQRAVLCTTELQCAPWCTMGTFFWNFFLVVDMKQTETDTLVVFLSGSQRKLTQCNFPGGFTENILRWSTGVGTECMQFRWFTRYRNQG